MKAYKVEMLIIDFDKLGEDELKTVIENARYPNRCINPKVMKLEGKDIGEWSDEHPLNSFNTSKKYYSELFSQNAL